MQQVHQRSNMVLAALLVLAVGAVAGCRKPHFQDDVPSYPGPPGGTQGWQWDTHKLNLFVKETPDSWEKVNRFYQEKLGTRPNWTREELGGGDTVMWREPNMQLVKGRRLEPEPKDPYAPGRAVFLENAGGVVLISTWVAIPEDKDGKRTKRPAP